MGNFIGEILDQQKTNSGFNYAKVISNDFTLSSITQLISLGECIALKPVLDVFSILHLANMHVHLVQLKRMSENIMQLTKLMCIFQRFKS